MLDISLEELDMNSRALPALELISNSSRVISSTSWHGRMTLARKIHRKCVKVDTCWRLYIYCVCTENHLRIPRLVWISLDAATIHTGAWWQSFFFLIQKRAKTNVGFCLKPCSWCWCTASFHLKRRFPHFGYALDVSLHILENWNSLLCPCVMQQNTVRPLVKAKKNFENSPQCRKDECAKSAPRVEHYWSLWSCQLAVCCKQPGADLRVAWTKSKTPL